MEKWSGYVYLYGLIPSREIEKKEIPTFMGIDHKPSYCIRHKEITAIVCPVNETDYSQEQISFQLKNPDWLREKAYHHHECISLLHDDFTVLPFPFCTIFINENNLRQMLTELYPIFMEKLNTLHKKEEWNLKVYCNLHLLSASVAQKDPSIAQFQEKLTQMPAGKQYLMKKQLQQLIRTEVEKEQAKQWEALHQQLQEITSGSVIRKNWGKEITQRDDDMLCNCDYLIEEDKVQPFLRLIQENEQIYQPCGWTYHVTGPWPPYHFANLKGEG